MFVRGIRSGMLFNSGAQSSAPEDGEGATSPLVPGSTEGKGGSLPPIMAKPQGGDAEPTDGDSDDHSGDDLSSLDPKAQALIKSLRKEAASHRTKANANEAKLNEILEGLGRLSGSSDDENKLSPEERLASFQEQSEQLQIQNAILSEAVRHGIGTQDMEYFQFLVTKQLGELEEGQELMEEDLSAIAKKVKSLSNPGSITTSPKGAPSPAGGKSQMTAKEFAQMSMSEQAKLYESDPEVYKTLVAETRKSAFRVGNRFGF